jgi:hypothetical protein
MVLRFGTELAAWVAAPWAVASSSLPLSVLLLVFLVCLPALFNVRGDKNMVGIPVRGSIRIAIELVIMTAAVVGTAFAWPTWAVIATACLVALNLLFGMPRWRWLLGPDPATRAPDTPG